MNQASPAIPWSRTLDGLPLRVATPKGWVEVALGNLDALLVDHAHCEQKAASSAVALIGRFPEHPGLARRMISLAHEEMQHFRQVMDRIEARGGTLTKPLPDPYVQKLRDWAFRHRGGIGPLGDLLLASALVEARSCERFRVLTETLFARGVESEELRELGLFYLRLADAEGRHWELFRSLAMDAASASAVEKRLAEMAVAEGEIVLARPLEPRMH